MISRKKTIKEKSEALNLKSSININHLNMDLDGKRYDTYLEGDDKHECR